MSLAFIKKLVRYRTFITAISNAAITWTILIIAPLGLFAVVTCTLGVFISSLVIGNLSDRALFFLAESNDQQNLHSNTTTTLEANHPINEPYHQSTSSRDSNNSLIQKQIKKLLK
ncbi:MAG: CRISPR-associated protein Csx18 [Pseudanabaena sp. Salubria-1]|jgi:hypothetical protein|nr:CRISPR-associated protein Csx18 [Pseudanabaena sp. Salubria-1]